VVKRLRTAAVLFVVAVGLSGCSDVVRLPDCGDCRPIEMGISQTLEVELGSSRDVSNDPEAYEWIVADAGTMRMVSEDRGTRPEDEDEFVGGYSTYVVYQFEPTAVGSTQMQLRFVPTDDPSGSPGGTLDVTVNVAE
jgi:hypothetical protein